MEINEILKYPLFFLSFSYSNFLLVSQFPVKFSVSHFFISKFVLKFFNAGLVKLL